MSAQDILRVVPTLQSIAIVRRSIRFVKRKKKRSSHFINAGAENIVGAALIAEEHRFISNI